MDKNEKHKAAMEITKVRLRRLVARVEAVIDNAEEQNAFSQHDAEELAAISALFLTNTLKLEAHNLIK